LRGLRSTQSRHKSGNCFLHNITASDSSGKDETVFKKIYEMCSRFLFPERNFILWIFYPEWVFYFFFSRFSFLKHNNLFFIFFFSGMYYFQFWIFFIRNRILILFPDFYFRNSITTSRFIFPEYIIFNSGFLFLK